MATPVPSSTDIGRTPTAARLRRHLHDHWKSYAFQGALAILVGVLAILAPFAATLATTIFFGWLLLLGGIVEAISAIRAREAPGFVSNLLLAILAAVLGALILWNPLAGTITLTWLLATFLVFSGVLNFSIARAFQSSTSRFWIMVISGVIDIALALLLIFGLPLTAVWAVGLFVGVSFLTSGFGLLVAALDARKAPPAA